MITEAQSIVLIYLDDLSARGQARSLGCKSAQSSVADTRRNDTKDATRGFFVSSRKEMATYKAKSSPDVTSRSETSLILLKTQAPSSPVNDDRLVCNVVHHHWSTNR